MTDLRSYLKRRAREERARAAACGNSVVAASLRHRAEELQRRANACTMGSPAPAGLCW